MPIRKVKGGYKWGSKGKTYPSKKGAEKQAKAAYANGYKKKKSSYWLLQIWAVQRSYMSFRPWLGRKGLVWEWGYL